jgi:deoxyribodipyrimidine photo-lyase
MAAPTTIVWFRQDLRIADNPALRAAVDRGPVVPVYLLCDEGEGDWAYGGAKRVYLHKAIESLDAALRAIGLRLVLRKTSDCLAELKSLVEQTNASAVHWNRRYEPAAIARDTAIKAALKKDRIEVESFNGSLLYEPHEVATQKGDPYKVFSPYWRACTALGEPATPVKAPRKSDVQPPSSWPESLTLDALGLMPDHPWGTKVADHWTVTEKSVVGRLSQFCKQSIFTYKDDRNRPDLDATSMLSPALSLGILSPRQAYHTAASRTNDAPDKTARKGIDHFLSELGWREFSYHLIYHFPHTTDQPLRDNFAKFPWIDMRQGRHWLEGWQRGRTGYPIVDAGMRQLWETGWMHNRVRMIVASFLTKDLRIHWLQGARWFWDCLVDADLANNTQGWQWSAGCGADAQPYFRIFNPISQGEKFDPDGAYVRQWVPELADLPNNLIHKPWEAGVSLDYPDPAVDHRNARADALAAFEQIKGK